MLNATERAVRDAIVNKLVPWINGGAPFVLLDAPPRVIGSNRVTECDGSILSLERCYPNGRIGSVRYKFWNSENFNSKNVPYMGLVIEGEADVEVATTAETCTRLGIPGRRWMVNLPERSLLLAPANIAYSGGKRPHSANEHPETAYSKILWLEFQPTGVCCHLSTTEKGKLWSHPYCFFSDENFIRLAGDIIREMHEQREQYVPLVYSYLRVLGYLLMRSTGQESETPNDTLAFHPQEVTTENELVRKSVEYIDANLQLYALNVEHLANQIGTSPRHLTRLFQKELGMPVKDFLTTRRLTFACQLLIASSYTVKVIGWKCGYARASTFINAFTQEHGVTPLQYRRRHKAMSENP